MAIDIERMKYLEVVRMNLALVSGLEDFNNETWNLANRMFERFILWTGYPHEPGKNLLVSIE